MPYIFLKETAAERWHPHAVLLLYVYVRYIICLYQFLDILGLHCLFIYFQYGCTLTSQTEHISADYFEGCSHISA